MSTTEVHLQWATCGLTFAGEIESPRVREKKKNRCISESGFVVKENGATPLTGGLAAPHRRCGRAVGKCDGASSME